MTHAMTNTMTNTKARRSPRLRTLASRAPHGPRKRPHVPTKIDCLIEVANKLREARTVAEACSDRALIYFIDMTIGHVCDSLGDDRRAPDAAETPLILASASL